MLLEILVGTSQYIMLKEEFSRFSSILKDEDHLSSRANLLEQDYLRFGSIAFVSDCGYGFRNTTLTTIKAYKRFLADIGRLDLWKKYFSKFDDMLNAFKILDDVIAYFQNNDMLDDESIYYNNSFNSKEFDIAFEFLEKHGTPEIRENITFPEQRRYFKYKGVKFIWRQMHGQGTACQLIPVNAFSKWNNLLEWPMEFRDDLCTTIGIDDV